jgi:hypothetical protein
VAATLLEPQGTSIIQQMETTEALPSVRDLLARLAADWTPVSRC